ncbi:chymotrypsin-1-like [Ctenocephalides felis]|uniref:chymotrypsin-1-like n=1 Tax=Ctenocephalides felis TaxID=7515 RepID=UPI000E6E3B98|nr:chymotrypsin-1-like [Ctenocephalides felis]
MEMKILFVIGALIGASVGLPTDSNRIVNGINAKNGSAPYMASLRDINGNHFCGASILDERWILTAAHCLTDGHLDTVYVGSNHLSGDGEYYNVEEEIIHDKYFGQITGFKNDIALIKVSSAIKLSKNVRPIKLHKDFIRGGEKLKITGWGLTNQTHGEVPDALQELQVEALSNSKCKAITGVHLPAHLCTFKAPQKGVCMGDSGGPLVYKGKQVGVTSFVWEGCALGNPDFFTRVSLYVDWVKKMQKEYK